MQFQTNPRVLPWRTGRDEGDVYYAVKLDAAPENSISKQKGARTE